MEWISTTLNNLIGEYPADSLLQHSGDIKDETILEFFKRSGECFDDPSFKEQLKQAVKNHRDPGVLIDAMQRRIFEDLGIQGDYGIKYLGRLRKLWGHNAQLLNIFFHHVSREETALDEAEMSPEQFQQKMAAVDSLNSNISALQAHILQLPEDERPKLMAALQKQSTGQALSPEEHQLLSQAPVLSSTQTTPQGQAMTPDEQLAFFESLNRSHS